MCAEGTLLIDLFLVRNLCFTYTVTVKFVFVVDQAFGRTAGQPTRTLLNTWKGMWIIVVILSNLSYAVLSPVLDDSIPSGQY